MRLVVFDDFRLGVWREDDRILDVTDLVDDGIEPRDRMTALIASWDDLNGRIAAHIRSDDGLPVAEVTLRAPQPRPSKIVAAPVNYRRHQQEMGGDSGVYAGAPIKTIEAYAGFCKAPSSIVGPDGRIQLPYDDRRVDYEGEVGVVIGRTTSRVSRHAAHDYVFGYVPLLDITLRGEEDRSFRKSFDTFTPIGPAIVTADEIADFADIAFELSINTEIRQRGNTRDLIYDIPRLIEVYSEAMTLEPGDLIATGTPEGVGMIEPGDRIELAIAGVATLVIDAEARPANRVRRIA